MKCGKKYMLLVIPKKSFVYNTNYTYGANDRKIQSDSKIPKPSNVTGYAPQLYAWFLDLQNPYDHRGRSINSYSRRSVSSWNLMHAKYERATGAWLTAWLSRVGIWCVKFQYFKKVCSRENKFPFQMPTPDIIQTVHEHPVFGINRKIRFQKQLDDS